MKTIEAGNRFKQDYARWIKGTPLDADFADLLRMLTSGATLPANYRDRPLQGPCTGHRDCHLRGDVIVIYERGEKSSGSCTSARTASCSVAEERPRQGRNSFPQR
ncbi:MAG: type II toxin-antitoxin system mRNA interferase toxin, RelE/StbE family [Opitutus sp.]|nr:type II toxin-antitoxin system mRNA interferase toxin, RelE/StbE family [Opitutus sp.]